MRLITVITAACALAGVAHAQSQREAIVPEGTEGTLRFGYSAAVRAGDFVYLAGVVAGVADDQIDAVDEATMAAAFRRGFERVGATLEAAGASWDQVVEMTTYHTDMPAQIDIFAEVKNDFVQAPYPAWTAIDIDRLYPDGGLVEIKVIAHAPER